MESRKISSISPISLPLDYLKIVEDTVSEKFSVELALYRELRPDAFFKVKGEFFLEEVLLAISLMSEKTLSATTVYASTDYQSSDREEILQEKLNLMVDIIGATFEQLFSEKEPKVAVEKLAKPTLAELEDVALEWVKAGTTEIYTRVDKANILLDQIAEDWLAKHDPEWAEEIVRAQKESEKLFFTGRPSDSRIKH